MEKETRKEEREGRSRVRDCPLMGSGGEERQKGRGARVSGWRAEEI